MASVETRARLDFVWGTLPAGNGWFRISLEEHPGEGQYRWSQNSGWDQKGPPMKTDEIIWMRNQPDDHGGTRQFGNRDSRRPGEHCFNIHTSSYGINDYNCAYVTPYVCQSKRGKMAIVAYLKIQK